jgi:hypothetical protein
VRRTIELLLAADRRLLAVELWLSFLCRSYNGAMIVFLTEITPMIATYLIEVTPNKAMPGVWLSLAAVIGLAATLWSGSLRSV